MYNLKTGKESGRDAKKIPLAGRFRYNVVVNILYEIKKMPGPRGLCGVAMPAAETNWPSTSATECLASCVNWWRIACPMQPIHTRYKTYSGKD